MLAVEFTTGNVKWKAENFGWASVAYADGLLYLDLVNGDFVLAEEGELALVKAAPDRFTELARVRALEGEARNHPALAGDILLVRNGQEMAAFRLPVADRWRGLVQIQSRDREGAECFTATAAPSRPRY